jgi:Periplasmic binding protein
MHRLSHARILGLAMVAVLGITAACSDDGTTTTESSGEIDDTTATSAGTKATGEPIKVGFVNSEGGAFSVPELRVGNEVAEDYINDHLGGVNGRPLHVTRCVTDGSPESSIDCANQFVEAGVVAAVEGTDLGGDAMLPILADAQIPLVGHVQFGPGRMFDGNAYYFGPPPLPTARPPCASTPTKAPSRSRGSCPTSRRATRSPTRCSSRPATCWAWITPPCTTTPPRPTGRCSPRLRCRRGRM